jgi:hypothetical protein
MPKQPKQPKPFFLCQEHSSALINSDMGVRCLDGGEYITDESMLAVGVAFLYTWEELIDEAFKGYEFLLDSDGEEAVL